MTDAERMEMLALMARIEAKVDHVLEQLDGLLGERGDVGRTVTTPAEERTVH
jgi:hypothetical protein